MYKAVIRVLGLGGGGGNAVDRMIQVGIDGVEFVAANTDAQALARSQAPTRIHLGPHLTRGLGAGGDPACGREAALASRADIQAALRGADIVFLAAGLGGGTGTGAMPVAAQIARDLGALVVAIVTMPFSFEGGRRASAAREGLAILRDRVHTLIVVPNDRLLQIVPRDMPCQMAFQVADDALRQGVQGLADLISRPSLINLDYANVRALMERSGGALLAIGQGEGENKAVLAAQAALHHPLLDVGTVDQAQGLLVHITGGEDLGLFEVREAVTVLSAAARPDAEVMFGAAIDPLMNGRAELILVATGVGGTPVEVPQGQRPAHAVAPAMAASKTPGFLESRDRSTRREPLEHREHADHEERDDFDVPTYARRSAGRPGDR